MKIFLQSNDRSLKVAHITREVVDIVTAQCPDCSFTDASIDKQSFSCYSDSPSYVTYRARLEGTSQTDSNHFISLIEQWVSDGASVIVTEVLLKVDSMCSVEISNLSEDECIMKPVVIAPTPVSRPITLVTTEPTLSGQDDPQSLTIILTVIGIIVIVIVAIIAVTATIIAVLVLRNCRAEYDLKSFAKMCVTISNVINCAIFNSIFCSQKWFKLRLILLHLLTEVVQWKLKMVQYRQPAMKPMRK